MSFTPTKGTWYSNETGTDIYLVLRLYSFSNVGTATVRISPDGGTNTYDYMKVSGNSTWDYMIPVVIPDGWDYCWTSNNGGSCTARYWRIR